jgi:cytochrome oxidase Cu insertion factor (SCO1/SenC/PrrC family)
MAWLPAALALAVGPVQAHEAHDEGAAAAPGPALAAELRFEPPAPGSYALPPIDTVGAHTLLDPEGEPAPLLRLEPGQVAFLSFVYLSCTDACPAATATLQRLDRLAAEDPRLAGRVQLVTVSFDPARDTPAAMARFREQLARRGSWRFLTARDAEAMAPVLEAFGQDATPLLARGGDPTGALRHVLKVFLVDDARRVRNVYSTGFLDARVLVNDALTVLGEAGAGD